MRNVIALETRDLGELAGALCPRCTRLTSAARCCGAEPVPLDWADPAAVILSYLHPL